MKRATSIIAVVLAVGCAGAGWRGRFDEQFAAASSRWTPAALGPIAWYKGDGNSDDAVGLNNGSWVSTPSYYSLGICGSAFATTAAVTSIQLPVAVAPTNNQPFSVSIWAKWAGTPAAGVIAGNANIGISGWFIRRTATAWDFTIHDKDNKRVEALSPHGGAGANWVHLVGTYTGTDVVLYINGVSKNTQTSSTYLAYYSYTYIARYGIGNAVGMTGYQDDFMIFDRALSPTEVKKLYDETVKRNGRAW